MGSTTIKSGDTLLDQVMRASSRLNQELFPPNCIRDELARLSPDDLREAFPLRYGNYLSALRNTPLDSALLTRLDTVNRVSQFLHGVATGDKSTELFTHQQLAYRDLSTWLERGEARGWIKLPTGSGKTAVFASLTGITGLQTLILVPRVGLIGPTQTSLARFGGIDSDVGAFYGKEKSLHQRVIVSTYQSLGTFVEEATRKGRQFPLVICDEAHRALTKTGQANLARIPGALTMLGLTATPDFSEIKSVRHLFGSLIHQMTIVEGIHADILSGARVVFVKTGSSLDGVGVTSSGDFQKHILEARLNTAARNEAALRILTSPQLAGKSKVVNCFSIDHANDLADKARKRGVNARAIHGEISNKEKEDIHAKFARGDLDAMLQVDLLTEGWDCPRAKVCLNLKPTRSPVVSEQRGGRVLRKYENQYALFFEFVDDGSKNGSGQITMVDVLAGAAVLPQSVEEQVRRDLHGLGRSNLSVDLSDLPGMSIVMDQMEVLEVQRRLKEGASGSDSSAPLTQFPPEYFRKILDDNGYDAKKISRMYPSHFLADVLVSESYCDSGAKLVRDYFRNVNSAEIGPITSDHARIMIKSLLNAEFLTKAEFTDLRPITREQMVASLESKGIVCARDLLGMQIGSFYSTEFPVFSESVSGKVLVAQYLKGQGKWSRGSSVRAIRRPEIVELAADLFPSDFRVALCADQLKYPKPEVKEAIVNLLQYTENLRSVLQNTIGSIVAPKGQKPYTLLEVLAANARSTLEAVTENPIPFLYRLCTTLGLSKDKEAYLASRNTISDYISVRGHHGQATFLSSIRDQLRNTIPSPVDFKQCQFVLGPDRIVRGFSVMEWFEVNHWHTYFDQLEHVLARKIDSQERSELGAKWFKDSLRFASEVLDMYLFGAKGADDSVKRIFGILERHDSAEVRKIILEKSPQIAHVTVNLVNSRKGYLDRGDYDLSNGESFEIQMQRRMRAVEESLPRLEATLSAFPHLRHFSPQQLIKHYKSLLPNEAAEGVPYLTLDELYGVRDRCINNHLTNVPDEVISGALRRMLRSRAALVKADYFTDERLSDSFPEMQVMLPDGMEYTGAKIAERLQWAKGDISEIRRLMSVEMPETEWCMNPAIVVPLIKATIAEFRKINPSFKPTPTNLAFLQIPEGTVTQNNFDSIKTLGDLVARWDRISRAAHGFNPSRQESILEKEELMRKFLKANGIAS